MIFEWRKGVQKMRSMPLRESEPEGIIPYEEVEDEIVKLFEEEERRKEAEDIESAKKYAEIVKQDMLEVFGPSAERAQAEIEFEKLRKISEELTQKSALDEQLLAEERKQSELYRLKSATLEREKGELQMIIEQFKQERTRLIEENRAQFQQSTQAIETERKRSESLLTELANKSREVEAARQVLEMNRQEKAQRERDLKELQKSHQQDLQRLRKEHTEGQEEERKKLRKEWQAERS